MVCDEWGEKFDCGRHGHVAVRPLEPGILPCFDCLASERKLASTAVVGFHRRYRCNTDGTVVEVPVAAVAPHSTVPHATTPPTLHMSKLEAG